MATRRSSSLSSSGHSAVSPAALRSMSYVELCGLQPPLPPSVSRVEGELASGALQLDDELRARLYHSPGRGIQPGQIIARDFRTEQTKKEAERAVNRPLKLVQWNIERGYKLPEIIALLRAEDADVVALQEVDLGLARTDWVDTGLVIASALGLNYSFVCEFVELYSSERTPEIQGGGVHGNAILSRFAHENPRAIEHRHAVFDWNSKGHLKREPRIGRRYTLAVEIRPPSLHPGRTLQVYSAHLEVFSGILGRLRDFGEILADARVQAARGAVHQAILGDFNTLSHGIARLSPAYCNDRLRLTSLGYTEAEWWTKFVLTVGADEQSKLDAYSDFLSADSRRSLLNPSFYDPFDCYADSTLTNYQGWFQGKLDWMLLRNLTHTSIHISNNDYAASDHKLLACSVVFDQPSASNGTHTDAASTQNGVRTRTKGAINGAVASAPPSSAPSPAASLSSSFPSKSSARLRQLMPLRRPRPGIVTSSSNDPRIYLTQIAAFWIVVALLVVAVLRWTPIMP